MLYHELIGLEVELLASPNLSEIGIEGRVFYETKNMLLIRNPRGDVRVPKENRLFLFRLPSGRGIVVLGDKLVGRPEERVKRV